jgi:hypothetical protein
LDIGLAPGWWTQCYASRHKPYAHFLYRRVRLRWRDGASGILAKCSICCQSDLCCQFRISLRFAVPAAAVHVLAARGNESLLCRAGVPLPLTAPFSQPGFWGPDPEPGGACFWNFSHHGADNMAAVARPRCLLPARVPLRNQPQFRKGTMGCPVLDVSFLALPTATGNGGHRQGADPCVSICASSPTSMHAFSSVTPPWDLY